MRTAEGRESEVSGVGMAGMDFHAGATLVDVADGVEAAQVKVGMDAVRVEIQRDSDNIEVASALADSEERALDAVGSREKAQLRGSRAGAAVVVRVQRKRGEIAAGQVTQHPLDLVGVDIRRRIFDRGREVEDNFVFRSWLPDIGHGLTNLEGEIEFRAREALGRVFESDV